MGRLLALLAALLLSLAAFAAAPPATPPGDGPTVEVFVREGCPHCAKAEEFLAGLGREKPGLRFVIRDGLHEPGGPRRLPA